MSDCVDFTSEICAYANFLNQPLKLEMFVPCDEKGNVIEDFSCELADRVLEKGGKVFDEGMFELCEAIPRSKKEGFV